MSATSARPAAATARAAGLAATLSWTSCSLSGCLLHFGPSHSDMVRKRDTTSAAPTTTTTTVEATTTSEFPHCSNNSVFLKDVRPQAAPLVEQAGKFQDEGDCCSACHASDDCSAWVFFHPTQTCRFLPKKAVWSAPSAEQLFIAAEGYFTGMKEVVTCDGCNDCGRNWDEQSWWKDCTGCSDPANWNQYPCFLPDGCKCGGDMSPWIPPDPCEAYWNQDAPCADDNWNPDCCDPCAAYYNWSEGEPCQDYNWKPECCDPCAAYYNWSEGEPCQDYNWKPECCGGNGGDQNPNDQGDPDDPWNPVSV